MGGTESKTTVDVLNEMSVDVAQKSVGRCTASTTQAQRIKFGYVGGDFVLKDTTMKQEAALNFKCAMSAAKQSEIQGEIANKIAQFAAAKGPAVLGALGSSTAHAAANIKNKFATTVNTSTLQESVTASRQLQEVGATHVAGDVVIANLDMEQGAKVVAEAIISDRQYQSVIQSAATAIDQRSKAVTTNPVADMIGAIGGIFKGMTAPIVWGLMAFIGFIMLIVILATLSAFGWFGNNNGGKQSDAGQQIQPVGERSDAGGT